MSFQQLNATCYYFQSSVNIGYVQSGTTGLLIDAGIDKSSIKKVLKELKDRELPLTHLFITHAHADHYGGAAYIQENYEVYTYAPTFEEAILRNPKLEPLYLFGGNDPVQELRNKFLEGESIRIDEVISEGSLQAGEIEGEILLFPGHSYHQLALKVNGILYAADSYFGEDALRKHIIPYITDTDLTIKSLEKLLSIEIEGAVPGHGPFEENPSKTIQQNIDVHARLLDWLENYIIQNEGVSHESVVAAMCDHYEVNTPQLSQWLLYRTAVTAYLIALKKDQRIQDDIAGHRWVFHSSAKS
ncbi:MBL fold metallo-hydrolase [Halobacillus mangrovi]|uniref:MBL fold metallo-hydrolase n=1 Tax=Halobacillus mangrovi TaxID=402384 RepID=A0A1W5ZXC9_9BACI|nr:MBL fold metallo-hydrolase [Halobacillus mangrovi]ARI77996.1 MBL fold metallo-hydrolase [Halobacillus mangrovi]